MAKFRPPRREFYRRTVSQHRIRVPPRNRRIPSRHLTVPPHYITILTCRLLPDIRPWFQRHYQDRSSIRIALRKACTPQTCRPSQRSKSHYPKKRRRVPSKQEPVEQKFIAMPYGLIDLITLAWTDQVVEYDYESSDSSKRVRQSADLSFMVTLAILLQGCWRNGP